MKTINILLWLTVSIVLFSGIPLLGATLPHQEILSESDRSRGNIAGIQWKITIDSIQNGRHQKRTLKLKAKDVNSLAVFLSPAKVKGRKLLMRDRNMWFIKPGLKKPVPISPRQKLMGGASYGDIASTNYAGDYRVTDASETVINGEPCYKFNLVAVDRKTTYDRIDYWISKERLTGIKAEFFTVSGTLFKTAVFEYENRISINGKPHPFVSKMTITDAMLKENITTLYYSNIKAKPVSDATFDLNLLVR